MTSNFSPSKFSKRIALELQRKLLATVLAILLQPGGVQQSNGRMHQPVRETYNLYGPAGRKYLTARECRRFAKATEDAAVEVRLFCLTLMWGGGRLSETLALTPYSLDLELGVATIETLKRRTRRCVRQVPMPRQLLQELDCAFDLRAAQRDPVRAGRRLWSWSRTTAWRRIKAMMVRADIHGPFATPKGLRHAFGVAAFQNKVPPHLVQRWLGHASFRTTAIYGNVVGSEERAIASRMWRSYSA